MMNLQEFMIKVDKTFSGGNIDKRKLDKCFSNPLPRPLRDVDFSHHFHASDRFVYGSYDIAYASLSNEEIAASCEIFKDIFREFLDLKAELEIEKVIHVNREYEDNEGCIRDDSFSFYLVSWVVVL